MEYKDLWEQKYGRSILKHWWNDYIVPNRRITSTELRKELKKQTYDESRSALILNKYFTLALYLEYTEKWDYRDVYYIRLRNSHSHKVIGPYSNNETTLFKVIQFLDSKWYLDGRKNPEKLNL
jgi:hypothetical protein